MGKHAKSTSVLCCVARRSARLEGRCRKYSGNTLRDLMGRCLNFINFMDVPFADDIEICVKWRVGTGKSPDALVESWLALAGF